jgi:hypothetical protein
MKAIINEKLYDTTTSEVVYIGNMEALYKTNNKAYFRTSSEGIQPMGIEEVKEYLGIKDVDAYIKEFGSVDIA